jgi:hypothetical protein
MLRLRCEAVGNHSYSGDIQASLREDEKPISRLLLERVRRLSLSGKILLAGLLLMTGCDRALQGTQLGPAGGDWHEFQGTWTTSGSRNIMPLAGDRRASISNFSGSLVLAGSSRLDVGFRAEAIVFNDSLTGLTGRAVSTDEHGDQAFSELQLAGTPADRKIVGKFIGGTGRYAGATGTYEFAWRFVLESEDGNVQGESVGLKGRVRVDSAQASSAIGDPRL